jgi:hypothetical protein
VWLVSASQLLLSGLPEGALEEDAQEAVRGEEEIIRKNKKTRELEWGYYRVDMVERQCFSKGVKVKTLYMY